MCTGAEIPMIMGAGLSAVSAYSGSKANKQALQSQGAQAAENAATAELQARDAMDRGRWDATKIRTSGNQLKGRQRVAMAANGMDLGVGSNLQLLTDTDLFTEIDAVQAMDNAGKEAWALRRKGANETANAGIYRGRADSESPGLAGGVSLLGSAARVADRWYPSGAKTGGPGDGLSQGDRRKLGVY